MSTENASLEVRLDGLEGRAAVAFMATLTERLLPNYMLYAELGGQGDTKSVRVMLDLVWEALNVRDAKIDFARQADKLTEIEPDIDEDQSFGARVALDTTMALSCCLDALQNALQKKKDSESPVEVSRLSIGGVARYIELSEGDGLDDDALTAHIEAHALMADECAFQYVVLELVEQAPLDRDRLRELRRLGRNEGVSNIGLSTNDE
ncbi:YjaG family protein [Phytohalomonas tamaricis]|uniref:YjaG family protein n=1 Tax=Phytohalomonas tamaricis TaxID=2081032 RepID=UPI000D0B027C|nr:YjaG family protein [Phytohalomonas tamaricis]